MPVQVKELTREFTFQKGKETIKLPDPNPAFSPQEVGKFYASKHPELTNATVEGPKVTGTAAVHEFRTTVGTKG